MKDVEKPAEPKLHDPRQSRCASDEVVPRRFLPVLSADEPPPLTNGSGRLELADAIVRQPIADARDRQPRLEVALRHRHRRHRRATSASSANGRRNPELLEYLAQSFVDNGYSIKKLHRQIMLSAVYQLGLRRFGRRTSRRTPATVSTGAPTAGG